MAGRGKKINRNKNAGSARDFEAGKRLDRPKQEFIPLDPPNTDPKGFKGGAWRKAPCGVVISQYHDYIAMNAHECVIDPSPEDVKRILQESEI